MLLNIAKIFITVCDSFVFIVSAMALRKREPGDSVTSDLMLGLMMLMAANAVLAWY